MTIEPSPGYGHLNQLRGMDWDAEPTREWPAWSDWPGEALTVGACLRLEAAGYCYDVARLPEGGWRLFYWR